MHNFNFLMPLKGNATKTFIFEEDEWRLKKNYKAGKFFKGYEIPISDLRSAYDILKENQDHSVFMIHGAIIEGTDKNNMIRRKRLNPKDGLKPTITDRNLSLFCLDIDGYENSDIEEFITNQLPEEFHTVDYIYQYSASYGLTTEKLNCHLFFWLKKSVHNLDIKEWIKNYNKEKGWGNIIDDSILNCAQPIYTQKRICEGNTDPIKNFIGYIEKLGELDWVPDAGERLIKNKNGDIRKSEYDLTAGVEKILTSENYHEELNKLALSLINKKVPANTVKEMLEGAMNAARRGLADKKRLEEWDVRFADISRSVDSAVEIVNNPTIEEILHWIAISDILEVKANFASKVLNLNPIDKESAIQQIVEKIDYGVAAIKKTIKTAKQEALKQKLEAIKIDRAKKREEKGIYEIELTIENSGEVSNKVCKILAKSEKEPRLFTMGGGLVSVRNAHPKTINQCHKLDILGIDYPKMPIVQPYKKPFSSLIDRLKKDIAIINKDGKDIEPSFHLLNVVGEAVHNSFKPLTGIIESPFINRKWELMNKNGYDQRTGLFTVLHKKLKITKMNAKEAYKYLAYTVFDEFPFSSDLDRAVAVSALLTAIQRPTIAGDNGFPGFGIVSPIQSSGKTTMAQLISFSAFNRPIAATKWSDDDDELGKHLLAILQEGHSCVLFDNIKQANTVQSDCLSNAMSTDIFSGRKLGENRTIQVPASVVWLYTGNGIKFVGDFATRVYPININPKMEDPNTRVFKRDNIGQWAMDNRKHIISAILSIVIEGKNLGYMNGGTRFKEWDKFVRRPILKITDIDLNEAVKKNQMDDPLKLEKTDLLQQLFDVFGTKEFTTKEVLKFAFGFEGGESELGDALSEVLENMSKNSRSVGRFLMSLIDGVFGGLMLQKRKSNIVYWRIVKN